jgi:acetoacetate decarboxylase
MQVTTVETRARRSMPEAPLAFGGLRRLAKLAKRGGWMFTDARFVAARVAIDPDVAAEALPFGLRMSRPATATLFVASYPETSFGSIYNEAGLFLHARHFGRDVVHCPWMLVDDDVALIAGRELLGYPKKIGRIDIAIDGDRAEARVERRGAPILELRATFGAPASSPPPMLGRPARNVWGAMGLSMPRLLSFTPVEQILEAREIELGLTVHEARLDPIARFGFGRVEAAYFYRVNIGGRSLPVPTLPVSPLFPIKNLLLRYL